MASLIQTLWRRLRKRSPRLICDVHLWNSGVDELRRRAGGFRESGAFLLGCKTDDCRRINKFIFYDDLDPTCFARGIVEFDGRNFGKLWNICRDLNMTVVADVHIHPGHYSQSSSDRLNPMIPQDGHLALIIPDYARRARLPGAIGLYEYKGSHKWLDHSRQGNGFFHVGWWP